MTRLRVLLALLAVLLNVQCDGDDQPFGHLVIGDAEHPLEELPPAFTRAQTTAMRQGFDWNTTTALAETDEQGNPALVYAVVLIGSRESMNMMYLSGITFDPYPLFDEDRTPWSRTGILSPEGDDYGTFAYALLPAAAYNLFRSEALAGRPVFGAVLRVDPPSSVTLPSGFLSYEALAERGFTGEAPWSEQIMEPLDENAAPIAGPIRGTHQKIRWLRRLARGLRAISDGIRRGIAAVRVALGDTKVARLRIRVVERDEDFLGHVADPTDDADLITQAWQGTRRGQPIFLRGARVTFSANMWMVQRFVDANGFVQAEIPDSRRLRIQLWLQSDAAEMTASNGVFDRRINIEDDAMGSASPGLNISIADSNDAYIIAQATDAWSYAREVLHFTPRPAIIVNLPANRDSFSPCLSYVRLELISAAFVASGALVLGGVVAEFLLPPPLSWIVTGGAMLSAAVAPLAVPDWDMMVQGEDAESRLIPTHEYGHVHWCAQLRDVSHAAVARGLIEGLKGLAAGQNADDPRRYITEAWADFLSAQVAGGVNYFELHSASGRPIGDNFFCDAAEQSTCSGALCTPRPCLEDNWKGSAVTSTGTYPFEPVAPGAATQDMNASVGTFATLLVDAFDGATSTTGGGTEWSFVGATPTVATGSFKFINSSFPDPDEDVQLPPEAWLGMLHVWRDVSRDWTETPVLTALHRVAVHNGFSETEVCDMIALHQTTLSCPKSLPSLPAGQVDVEGEASRVIITPTQCLARVEYTGFLSADNVSEVVLTLFHNGSAVETHSVYPGPRNIVWQSTYEYLDILSQFSIDVDVRLNDGGSVVRRIYPSGGPLCIE